MRLHAYQEVGVEWLLRPNRFGLRKLLGDGPGVGKSGQALKAAERVRGLGGDRRYMGHCADLLVVCPKSVAASWRDEAAKWRPDMEVLEDAGRLLVPSGGGPLCVVTWPQSLASAWACSGLPRSRPLAVVVDEPHIHRDLRSKWVHIVAGWTRHAAAVWGTDGTPIFNRPDDLWTVLCLLGCAPARGDFDLWAASGVLRTRLTEAGVLLRRTIWDVEGDIHLPPLTRSLVRARIPLDCLASPEWQGSRTAVSLRVAAGSWKWSLVRDLVEARRLDGATPTILWHVHKEAARRTVETLGGLGVRAVGVTGTTSQRVRERVFADFQAGVGPEWLVLTQCAQAGIQLQRARVTVLCETPWEAKAQDQAVARMWRQGQTQPTTEITLAWDHEVDSHVLESCHNKNLQIGRTGF